MKKYSVISNIFLVMAVALVLYSFFIAGFSASTHQYATMGFNLIIGVAWTLIAFATFHSKMLEVEGKYLDRELNQLKKFGKALKSLADEKDQQESKEKNAFEDRQIFEAILKDLGYEKTPPPSSEFSKIENAYHENRDNFVRLIPNGEDGIVAYFSDDKYYWSDERIQAESGQRLEKPSTKIPVVDGDVGAEIDEQIKKRK